MDRHITWENLSALIEAGVPALVPLQSEPRIHLRIEVAGSLLALLIPLTKGAEIPKSALETISIDRYETGGQSCIRILTSVRPLYREFYLLATEIADKIQEKGLAASEAIQETLTRWKALLRSALLLSPEREIGVLGEMWVLRRLLRSQGPTALDFWTGAAGEVHDFRFNSIELEVKSTRNRQRLHIITALEQMIASPERDLYVLSLQFALASGQHVWSLPGMVDNIRSLLSLAPGQQDKFNRLLESGCGYIDSQREHYTNIFELRSKPTLIKVDETCPRLTRESLKSSTIVGQRITDIRYTINLDGLGVEDDSPEFLSVLPKTHEQE